MRRQQRMVWKYLRMGVFRSEARRKHRAGAECSQGVSLGRGGLTSSEMAEGQGAKCAESWRSSVRRAWLCPVLAV